MKIRTLTTTFLFHSKSTGRVLSCSKSSMENGWGERIYGGLGGGGPRGQERCPVRNDMACCHTWLCSQKSRDASNKGLGPVFFLSEGKSESRSSEHFGLRMNLIKTETIFRREGANSRKTCHGGSVIKRGKWTSISVTECQSDLFRGAKIPFHTTSGETSCSPVGEGAFRRSVRLRRRDFKR